MAQKRREEALILQKNEIAPGIFDCWLRVDELAKEAGPGQFLMLSCKDGSRLLPRPISICEIGEDKRSLRLVFRVAGEGTKELSQMEAGERIAALGPLGNGFPLKERAAFLIGGGIGIPPILELSKRLSCKKQIVLGFRDEAFLLEDFKKQGDVYVATEDGSLGVKGTVLDAIAAHGLEADVIYACGPLPMLRALKEYAAQHGMECYVSLEERMACGIGACLGCVCQSKDVDAHTNVRNKRVCKEGPVFEAGEVEF